MFARTAFALEQQRWIHEQEAALRTGLNDQAVGMLTHLGVTEQQFGLAVLMRARERNAAELRACVVEVLLEEEVSRAGMNDQAVKFLEIVRLARCDKISF